MPVHHVEVWGRSYTVVARVTRQKTKTVWIAVGEYMGKTIQTEGRSKGAAIKRWKERAHSTGG